MTSRHGIRLPQNLLDKIGEAAEAAARPRGGPGRSQRVPRKEARKQDRAQKKQRKAVHFSKRASTEVEHPDSPQRKKVRLSKPESDQANPRSTHSKSKPDVHVKDGKAGVRKVSTKATSKPKSALEKLAAGKCPIEPPRSQRDKQEDEYITFLERKLGGGKGKGPSSKGLDDGLGDLLANLDYIGLPSASKGKARVASEEDEDDDEGMDDEWHGFGDDLSMDVKMSEALSQETAAKDESAPATRYIPPHLRAQAVGRDDSETLAKISKQLKGLLNRLSEQNIASILDESSDVTSTLTSLIINGISSHSVLLDSYVVLHAAFVSALHKIVGVEFAASFVQSVVSSYEQHHEALIPTSDQADQNDDSRGKECSNLIVLLSELYNFQVISCILIYDIIRSLLAVDLTEFDVELLLKLLRRSQLRQDDPSALKDIIQIVQDKISDSSQSTSSRTRFMLETLANLKNNKTKRSATQHAGGDAVERMKKFLSGLSKKKHVMAHDPLRVSLDDLHSAETKGKWWLVGAAWGGDPLVDRHENARQAEAAAEQPVSKNALVKLARKQGMNTDIRRSIFVVLMSSDDYVDACERLAQLNLTEVQQREIIRVILHCCGNEKSYNPYYTFVGQHLSRTSHSYKITLQFCLWDFLRDLGETTVGGAEIIKGLKDDVDFDVKSIFSTRRRNVAKAYAWWIAKDNITLAVFKPVDFMAIKPQTHRFLAEFCKQLFLSSQTPTPILSSQVKDLPSTRNRGAIEQIFIKATRIQALALGLVYFLTETFRKQDGSDEEVVFLKWASGVAVDTLRTGMDIISTL
ncbi:hypothetical protein EWM64_g793 [Hericium alpestre]|uniref:MI domain-containing protein n=1 Tax=Hericium alpestre TaxID=135208 RepID=A0A4Z0AB61_9AGAM|nr:hypothetical protein EWM64_g793 [Hericium alpestre]